MTEKQFSELMKKIKADQPKIEADCKLYRDAARPDPETLKLHCTK